MKQAKFYENLDNDAIRCILCNHCCRISAGQTGICRSRQNINGQLFSLTYGHPVSINADPIEKKPLFHFLPGSLTMSIGTTGCNLQCANCQNWSISQTDLTIKNESEPEIPPEHIISEAKRQGCRSISYTYNEPTIFAEYALDIMALAKKNGLKNIWVTNGFMTKNCLTEILPYLDAVNLDIKSFSEDFYKNNCQARLEPILENAIFLKKSHIHLEITTLIIPGLSDDLDMISNLANFIAKELGVTTPWHISKFFPDISWKLQDLSSTEIKTLEKIYDIGLNHGLKFVYIGNIFSGNKENTYCPTCNQVAIERRGYDIKRYDQDGICNECGADLSIVNG